MNKDIVSAVVVPIGPGKESALDTIESIAVYCPEPNIVVLVDDCTEDGTYEALLSQRSENWFVLRNPRSMGVGRLVHTLCFAYRFVLAQTNCRLVLRLDQDALIIKPGVLTDALAYHFDHPTVGLFGVYDHDYNRPRSFEAHRDLMRREMSWWRAALGLRPAWANTLHAAETHGYELGTNVFGGAYFVTRACLEGMQAIGALELPYHWHSRLMEDVFYSMAAVAAGFQLGHFAAPDGPLCLEWRKLPYPPEHLAKMPFKVVHSVDKGANTRPTIAGGPSAREFFRRLRNDAKANAS